MSETDEKKSFYEYLCIASKVYKDKCWYHLWNFELFTPVQRIYPDEPYYASLYSLITADADKIDDKIYLGSAFNAADENWLNANKITSIVNVTACISNYYPDDYKYYN